MLCSVNANPSLTHAQIAVPLPSIPPSSSNKTQLAVLSTRYMQSTFATGYINTDCFTPTFHGKALISFRAWNGAQRFIRNYQITMTVISRLWITKISLRLEMKVAGFSLQSFFNPLNIKQEKCHKTWRPLTPMLSLDEWTVFLDKDYYFLQYLFIIN